MLELVYDIEANGLELQDVTKVHCLCIYNPKEDKTYSYTNSGLVDNIHDGLRQLSTASALIAHNEVWYDLQVLKKLYGFVPRPEVQIIDTVILSRLINPDRVAPFNFEGKNKNKPHSIEVWQFRLGYAPKIQIEDWSVLTEPMLQRCKDDVRVNWDVYQALLREANE